MSRVVNVSSAGGPLDILRLLCSQMDLAVTLQFALAFAGFVSASKCPSPSPRWSNISSELLTCDGRDAEKGCSSMWTVHSMQTALARWFRNEHSCDFVGMLSNVVAPVFVPNCV